MEYAKLLKSKIADWPNLLIIMRAYLYVNCHSYLFTINIVILFSEVCRILQFIYLPHSLVYLTETTNNCRMERSH